MTDSLGSINGTEIKLSSYFNELGQLYYYAAIG